MSEVVTVPSWLPIWPLAVVAGTLLSLGIALRLARPRGAWGRRLRSRLFMGIPWGTLVTVIGIWVVFLVLQQARAHPRHPLVLPFRAWSYFYPLGILTAPFTHANVGHITSNLFATLVFAPIAEFAWSHFPTTRGSQSFSGWRSNPLVRILAFVLGIVGVGLLTGLFALGPVIGFSGVVFAFAGFALVWFPITTVLATAGMSVLSLLVRALANPIQVSEAGTEFTSPGWANIAIQGHALGLLLGVLLGGWLLARRDSRPTPGRLWLATILFGVAQGLWAIYWYRGGGRYVLYRAAGVVLLVLLAALLTAAITASDRPLLPRLDLGRREAAMGLLLCFTLALSGVAIPVNLVTVSEEPFETSVDVRDYTVTYAENVSDQYVSAINISAFGESTAINTSGVIVVSERRSLFWTTVSKSRLAYQGRATIVLGGPGWRETVEVNRTGWQAAGNSTVYKVFLNPPDGSRRLAFQSSATTVEPRIAGRRIQLRPTNDSFAFVVTDGNRTLGMTPLPSPGGNVTAGGLRFNRTDAGIVAQRNGTRIRIARQAT